MIKIISLSVAKEDCFLIKINDAGKSFNLLVDCGKESLVSKVKQELGNDNLHGIIITHIDSDHIVGITNLIKNFTKDCYKNIFIIFNKYDESLIAYKHGDDLLEQVTSKLSQRLLVKSYANNYNRENKKIERKRNLEDSLKVEILSFRKRKLLFKDFVDKETVYITLLTPDINDLRLFMKNWHENKSDPIVTNKSSITFLIEFKDKLVLMLGDAYSEKVIEAIKEIKSIEKIDCIKMSHHGAEENNKGIDNLAKEYRCENFFVTIPRKQAKNKSHPNKKLVESLLILGCKIQTSTNYEDEGLDYINRILKENTLEI